MGSDLVAGRELAWRLFVRDTAAQYGQSALGYLKQGSPVYVPWTWRFFTGSELTHTVKSRNL
jgi:hypothetical protein